MPAFNTETMAKIESHEPLGGWCSGPRQNPSGLGVLIPIKFGVLRQTQRVICWLQATQVRPIFPAFSCHLNSLGLPFNLRWKSDFTAPKRAAPQIESPLQGHNAVLERRQQAADQTQARSQTQVFGQPMQYVSRRCS
ncbi:hypothetical protein [Roseateles oligotrophus]|uniref:Uncharacterized protein n=1 Tax=Roseateles oligotrophus TaxID=1769250 RepID=A0ABT2YLW6_9BURK|nr:hypothetical protein [Roseateles oligotrophus]MCV2371074.1 hypothetical protein [Roseateles oligotrophus]